MRIEMVHSSGEESPSLDRVTDLSSGHEKAVHPTKGMSFREKCSYFTAYYLPKTLGIMLVIAFFSIFMIILLTKDTPKLRILAANHHDSYADAFHEAFLPYEKEKGYVQNHSIDIDASFNFDPTDFSQSKEKEAFIAAVSTREYSIFFSDSLLFQKCAEATYFRYLSDYLPPAYFEKFNDSLCYGYDDLTGEEYPCGIFLTSSNCPFLQNTNYTSCCVGVLFSDVDTEDFLDLLLYILDWKPSL